MTILSEASKQKRKVPLNRIDPVAAEALKPYLPSPVPARWHFVIFSPDIPTTSLQYVLGSSCQGQGHKMPNVEPERSSIKNNRTWILDSTNLTIDNGCG